MKHILTSTLITVCFLFSINAAAGERPQYKRNGALDNLFVRVGGGVNGVLDNGKASFSGLEVNAEFGKWFSPAFGIRLGWNGLKNQNKDSANGWFAGDEAFNFHYIHGDVLWDLTNAFGGYKRRLVSVDIYAHAGVINTSFNEVSQWELGAGAGLIVGFNITDRLSLSLDGRLTAAREEAWREAGKVILFPTVNAGVSFAFGLKTYKFEAIQPEVIVEKIEVLKDCDHEAKIAALQAEIDALNKRKAEKEIVTVDKYLDNGLVIYFDLDKWNISHREMYHLEDLVRVLPQNASLTIVGHADKETGSARRNEKLSKERVNGIEKALRSLGYKGAVNSTYKGDTANPFPANGDLAKAPKNRCVTIAVKIN